MGLLMYQRCHESFILSNEMQNKRPKYIDMPPKFLLALEAFREWWVTPVEEIVSD